MTALIATGIVAFGAGYFVGCVVWCLFDSRKVYEQHARYECAKRGVNYKELD